MKSQTIQYAVKGRGDRCTDRVPSSLPPVYLRRRPKRGFTLVEILVVITIILIVSAVALPAVLPAFSHRQVSEAARIVQGALVGARDKAIHSNQPSGIRLLPDPAFQTIVTDTNNKYFGFVDPTQILAANRIIPIDPAPAYSEGLVSVNFGAPSAQFQIPYPPGTAPGVFYHVSGLIPFGGGQPGAGVLMIEESVATVNSASNVQVNAPTSWYWNIRVGDKIQINNSGLWYTVVGPMISGPTQGNPEMFVNIGPPGTTSPLQRLFTNGKFLFPEFLFLVNGRDDNANGWVNEGWDGVDNNGNQTVNELAEWEVEAWPTTISSSGFNSKVSNAPYIIQRRPAPSTNAREVRLPTDVVIDLTTSLVSWGTIHERSRVPADAMSIYSGYVDIVVNPDGTILPTTIYSSPSSFDMTTGSFFHLWLAERGDLYAPPPNATTAPVLPVPQSVNAGAAYALKGDYRLITLFTRTGGIVTNSDMPFLFDANLGFTNTPSANTHYNVNNPYIQAQQGVQGGDQ